LANSKSFWLAKRMNSADVLVAPKPVPLVYPAPEAARFWLLRMPKLTLDELRACLFFEQRRFRHFGEKPSSPDWGFFWEVLKRIRKALPVGRAKNRRRQTRLEPVPVFKAR
jgi:hypothetical protein